MLESLGMGVGWGDRVNNEGGAGLLRTQNTFSLRPKCLTGVH